MFGRRFSVLNNSLTKVKTYVGSDGKLHFTDASGADSVLPFSNIKIVNGTFRASNAETTYTINVGFKPKYAFFYLYYGESGYFQVFKFGNTVKSNGYNRNYIGYTNNGFTFKPFINAYTMTDLYYFCATDE